MIKVKLVQANEIFVLFSSIGVLFNSGPFHPLLCNEMSTNMLVGSFAVSQVVNFINGCILKSFIAYAL